MTEIGEQLKNDTTPVRVHHTKFGARRSLSSEQRKKAAEVFKADQEMLSASMKLVDVSDEAYKACTSTIRAAQEFWRSQTVPFPENGLRLIHRDRVDDFNKRMDMFKSDLSSACLALDNAYGRLRTDAEKTLGDLFDEDLYPDSLGKEFALWWDYPSVEPPDYLKELNPKLWEQERERMSSRFEAAVTMAESAFIDEMAKLVTHLHDKLTGVTNDGKPAIFRDSAIGNVTEFLERFRSLNVGSNAELDKLVDQAEAAIGGVDCGDLRKDGELRGFVGGKLAEVRDMLSEMTVDKPVRQFSFDDDDGSKN